jgi:hypothetical protein
VLHNSTPDAYEQWLTEVVARTIERPAEEQIVFINAWNEWGEGCHLEPDLRWGHGYLEATRRAISQVAVPATNGKANMLEGELMAALRVKERR